MNRLNAEALSHDEKGAAILRWMAVKVQRARENPVDFFEFVIREETTRAHITTLPFQRLALQFMEHYNRFVIRLPVGFSKTYMTAAMSMRRLGDNNTDRGVVLSAAEGQSRKVVTMVRDYIEGSAELKLVYPELRRSSRSHDPWTQTHLVVERPSGIRDASIMAAGLTTKLPGARLSWVLLDDVLTQQNSASKESRDEVKRLVNTTVFGRRDVKGSKIGVSNTPWHEEDITYTLQNAGWPTIEMDAYGDIRFWNANEFDSIEIRASDINEATGAHRLTAHDTPTRDVEDTVPLWPSKFTVAALDAIKDEFYRDEPWAFDQLYKMRVVKIKESGRTEWINVCKQQASTLGIYTYAKDYRGPHPVVSGIDIGIGVNRKKNAKSSIFTFCIWPNGRRQILNIDAGHFTGSELIKKTQSVYERFGGTLGVESNAAQDLLRQWALELDISLPIRARHTGKNKIDPHNGVQTILLEIENGAWLIPNESGKTEEATEFWIDDVRTYSPDAHTGDLLMSCWIAREQARAMGYLRKGAKGDKEQRTANQLALSVSVR